MPSIKSKIKRKRAPLLRNFQIQGLALARSISEPADPHLLIPCGCKVEIHNFNGIVVKHCSQHNTFIYSPYHEEGDVFYFVNEEQRP